jgi:CSLREA domain-containing protein
MKQITEEVIMSDSKISLFKKLILVAITTLAVSLICSPKPIQAADKLTVTKLADTNDGVCDASDCSLREALATAASGAEIRFAQGLSGTITLSDLTFGGFSITQDVTIEGPGANTVTINGSGDTLLFLVSGSARLKLSGLTLANGWAGSVGSGGTFRIFVGPTVQLSACVIDGSQSVSGSGGAIFSEGTLVITDCQLRNNRAATIGGAIYALGNVTIKNSIFEDNTAGNGGGGITMDNSTLEIHNSTFRRNRVINSSFGGGGLLIRTPDATITNSTIQGNIAVNGAGIYTASRLGPLVKHTDIVNTTGGTNCFSTESGVTAVQDGGHNRQFPGNTCNPTIPVVNPG